MTGECRGIVFETANAFATTAGAIPLTHCFREGPVRLRPLFYVPAADFYSRFRRSQVIRAIGSGYFALLAGKERDVIVFPHDWQDIFALDAFGDLEADEECQTLAWIFQRYVGAGFFAFVLGAVGNDKLHLWKMC